MGMIYKRGDIFWVRYYPRGIQSRNRRTLQRVRCQAVIAGS